MLIHRFLRKQTPYSVELTSKGIYYLSEAASLKKDNFKL